MTATLTQSEPETLADVRADLPYRLRVAARLLGVHPDTVQSHALTHQKANPAELVFLPKRHANSPVQVWGAEILRQAGRREVDRAARTSEGSETTRARQQRVDADMARLRAALGGK